MKYFIVVLLILFVSCGSEETEKNSKPTAISTLDKLQGRWLEEEDSLHVIEFTSTEMVELYGGSEVNRYEVTIFNGMPGRGGYEEPTGKVIQIEESKDNFHHYTIVVLDSVYLELQHMSSGINRLYKRL